MASRNWLVPPGEMGEAAGRVVVDHGDRIAGIVGAMAAPPPVILSKILIHDIGLHQVLVFGGPRDGLPS